MSNANSYIVFEPDQVLTNDHLNELFDYLDTQERLTRNKLIGIGIVCGLEITYNSSAPSITISKGCGVTSYGYLIVLPDEIADVPLAKYASYTLPADPLYKPFINTATNKQFDLWLLLNEDQADASEETVAELNEFPSLEDMVVVLFLEANETDLKNCDTQDCNDKGKEIAFTVRPLLIRKTDMDTIIINQKKEAGDDSGLSNSYIERLGLKEIPFKRFDVTATSVSDAYDIFNAYALCLDDALLKNISDAYSQTYSVFQPVLDGYNTNPFADLFDYLKQRLVTIQQSLPIYIQYYYDFIDDLIKAYYEFKEKSFDLVTECCPDEELFPMHLMLGEATMNTSSQVRSPYRQYFIYSPLFNNQGELLAEVKLLFGRMVAIRNNFFIKHFDGKTAMPVKVTPSKWGEAPLSNRAIPYYYNINSVAPNWNYQKTKKGKANTNLSYNASSYVPAAPAQVQNPLLYNIEPYNFYRIEGHIGQSFDSVLKSITDIRNYNRLPFDVIALKAGDDSSGTNATQYDCNFQDLQAMYEIIKSELACKAHEPVCLVAKMPSSLSISAGGAAPVFNFVNVLSNTHSILLNQQINPKATVLTTFVTAFYSTKGAFLKANCPIVKGTIGEEYNNSIRKFFPRPATIDLSTSTGSRAALFHLIDTVEDLMLTINDSVLYYFKYDVFKKQYDESISYFRDFSVALRNADKESQQISPFLYDMLESLIYSCIDQKLKALTDEYNSRVNKIRQMNLLSDYIINNPGIDHKAGVPRGGTFIIVYYEVPAGSTATGLSSLSSNIRALDTISRATTSSALTNTTSAARPTTLAESSAITSSNMNTILKLFDSKELQLTSSQAATLKSLAVSQLNLLTGLTEQFRIPDKAVIADFYLPYLCCSNCAPVAYVFPREDTEKLSINIGKTEFCNNDTNVYPVTVSPAGGTLTDSAGGIVSGSLQFKAQGLAAGIDKITYTLGDGRSTSVDVKISAAPVIDFQPASIDSTTVKFAATGIDGKSFVWSFGDGTTSNTASPTHTFQFDGDSKTFTVKLTVTDGPCVVAVEHTVTVKNPQQQVFTIDPTLFCSNDEKTYAFKTDPKADDVASIKNEGGLVINKDTAGNVVFSPVKQQLTSGKQYHLELKGASVDLAIVVADASFTMNLTRKIDPLTGALLDTLLLAKAKHADANAYHWDITTNGRQLKVPDAPEAAVSYKKFDLSQDNTISIKLTITYNTPGGDCIDVKDYNLTPDIFKNHIDKGEFDNTTPA